MNKDKILGIIITLIGAGLVITGVVMTIIDVTKNELKNEISAQETEKDDKTDAPDKVTYFYDGVSYKDYGIYKKGNKTFFKVNVTNDNPMLIEQQNIKVQFLGESYQIVSTLDISVTNIKPNDSKDYEFEYKGTKLPKKYEVQMERIEEIPWGAQ